MGAIAIVAFTVIVGVIVATRSGSAAADGSVPTAAGAAGAVPDISSLSPRERAARLYDRVMRLHEERKIDSVEFFAPMALSSYTAIPDPDVDARYDMARIAMVAGSMGVARAQADTILRGDSTNLLGLLLSADLERATNNMQRAAQLEAKLVASAERERARNLPEYEAHGREIATVLERLQGKR